jgi:hypothetical protein
MRYTTIPGVSEERRLGRVGKIHLGVIKRHLKNNTEFPDKTDHFVFDKDPKNEPAMAARALYGDNARSLICVLPSDVHEIVFPQAYKYYKSGGKLWCTGNGIKASRMNTDWKNSTIVECRGPGNNINPCEFYGSRMCGLKCNLNVILPLVSVAGVWTIDTSSINSLIDLNSGIAQVLSIAKQSNIPAHYVPCLLQLLPRRVLHDGKSLIAYTLTLTVAPYDTIGKIRGMMENVRRMLGPTPINSLPPQSPEDEIETDLIPRSIWDKSAITTPESHSLPEAVFDAEPIADAPTPEPMPRLPPKPKSSPPVKPEPPRSSTPPPPVVEDPVEPVPEGPSDEELAAIEAMRGQADQTPEPEPERPGREWTALEPDEDIPYPPDDVAIEVAKAWAVTITLAQQFTMPAGSRTVPRYETWSNWAALAEEAGVWREVHHPGEWTIGEWREIYAYLKKKST